MVRIGFAYCRNRIGTRKFFLGGVVCSSFISCCFGFFLFLFFMRPVFFGGSFYFADCFGRSRLCGIRFMERQVCKTYVCALTSRGRGGYTCGFIWHGE